MSITNKLNQIKNAIYGKEVRGAIHDAIKECYDDASVNHDNANMEVKMARGTHNTLNDRLDNVDEIQAQTNAQLLQKVSKEDLDVERKRIDSLTKLQSGSTTGDAELIDGRIGADGITYVNLGTAIRTQISNISGNLNNEFINGGLTNGEITDIKYRIVTKEIIEATSDLMISVKSGFKIGIHYYNESDLFLYDSGWRTNNFGIKKGRRFRLVISSTDDSVTNKVSISDFRKAINVANFTNNKSKLNVKLHFEKYEITYSGVFRERNSRLTTSLVFLKKGDVLETINKNYVISAWDFSNIVNDVPKYVSDTDYSDIVAIEKDGYYVISMRRLDNGDITIDTENVDGNTYYIADSLYNYYSNHDVYKNDEVLNFNQKYGHFNGNINGRLSATSRKIPDVGAAYNSIKTRKMFYLELTKPIIVNAPFGFLLQKQVKEGVWKDMGDSWNTKKYIVVESGIYRVYLNLSLMSGMSVSIHDFINYSRKKYYKYNHNDEYTHLFDIPTDLRVQGCCKKDDSIFIATVSADNAHTNLVEYSISQNRVINSNDTKSYQHSGDMTFDTKKDKIIVISGMASPTIIYEVNPNTLECEKEFKVNEKIGAIAYNKEYNLYICELSSNGWEDYYFGVYDDNFNQLYTFEPAVNNLTLQGIDCENDFIYAMYSGWTSTGWYNKLFIYTLDGTCVKNIVISNTAEEFESLVVDGEKIYICTDSRKIYLNTRFLNY